MTGHRTSYSQDGTLCKQHCSYQAGIMSNITPFCAKSTNFKGSWWFDWGLCFLELWTPTILTWVTSINSIIWVCVAWYSPAFCLSICFLLSLWTLVSLTPWIRSTFCHWSHAQYLYKNLWWPQNGNHDLFIFTFYVHLTLHDMVLHQFLHTPLGLHLDLHVRLHSPNNCIWVCIPKTLGFGYVGAHVQKSLDLSFAPNEI